MLRFLTNVTSVHVVYPFSVIHELVSYMSVADMRTWMYAVVDFGIASPHLRLYFTPYHCIFIFVTMLLPNFPSFAKHVIGMQPSEYHG